MSGNYPGLLYWDACLFIAWLTNEQRDDPAEMVALQEQAELLNKGRLEIVTSTITQVEVLQSRLPFAARSTLEKIFQRPNLRLVATSRRVAALAHDIRDFYATRNDDLPPLTTPDAIHLASAISEQCGKFLTFDGKDRTAKSRALLPLNGVVAGRYRLAIERPLPGATFQPMSRPEQRP